VAKVLIVDDEKMICEEFRDILQEDNHEVDVAFNGEEALRKVQEKAYDLVFLDVLMPRMEGSEVFLKMKEITHAAIAIMSGFLPSHKEKEIVALGAVACFRKPLDLGRIKKLIQTVESQGKKN
jgi:DNA-binding response OmpR family regulator